MGLDKELCEVVKLDNDNYQQWKIELRDSLEALDLWEIVDGIEKDPEGDDTAHRAWKKKDSKARSILRKTLDSVHFNHVRDCMTSRKILERLKELKEPQGVNILLEAWKDFTTYDWKEGMDVTTFWSGLTVIIGKVEACGKKVEDELAMAKILGSLRRGYQHFVTSCNLTSSEATSLATFRQRLLAAERSIKKDDTLNDVGDAYRAGTSARMTKPKQREEVKQKKASKKRFQGKCFHCNKVGHMKSECFLLKRDEKGETGMNGNKEDSDLYASSALQYQSEKDDAIIIDSGALIHMTRRLDWFKCFQDLDNPLSITIADNKVIHARGIGDIDVKVLLD